MSEDLKKIAAYAKAVAEGKEDEFEKEAGAKVDAVGKVLNAAKDKLVGAGKTVVDAAKDVKDAYPGTRGMVAKQIAKNNPRTTAGLAGAGVIGTGLAGYAATRKSEEKVAADRQVEMEEVALAKEAAYEMYQDAMEKIAFAEQLFAEADELEKQAADNAEGADVSWVDQVKTPVGAALAAGGAAGAGMIGAIAGEKGKLGPLTPLAGGILAAGLVAGTAGAFTAFREQHRNARAQNLAASQPR